MKAIKKLIHLYGSILKFKLTGKQTPLVAVLCVTGRCNFNCVYCYGMFGENKTVDPQLSKIKILLKELAEAGCTFIQITGGEPLVRDDLDEIVDEIKRLKMQIGIVTNGSLVEKRLDLVLRFDMVCISYDGPGDCHNLNRGQNHDQVIAGADALKKAGKKFKFSTILTINNFAQIDEILKVAEDYKVQIDFNFMHDTYDGGLSGLKDIVMDDAQIKETIGRLIEFKRQGRPVEPTLRSLKYALNWPFGYKKTRALKYEAHQIKNHVDCYLGKTQLYINYDGNVYPCPQLVNRINSRNVYEDGLAKSFALLSNSRGDSCVACWGICFTENNLIFDMNLWTMLKIFKRLLKGK
ncbi:MAG: radical SAM protein [Bacteriovoracaceae bacterium]|nr:radical SAM protein [Bacteriovoracaceae bacterium]